MTFDFERFFLDVFAPVPGDVVTVMHDEPHAALPDNPAWSDRRRLAGEWRDRLAASARSWGVRVTGMLTYPATGCNNGDLPDEGRLDGRAVRLADLLEAATIVMVLPEYSATGPLSVWTTRSPTLRVGSMPRVARVMQESALAADYRAIARRCRVLKSLFDPAVLAEATFSSGHACRFDLSTPGRESHIDDGYLHPEVAGTNRALSNLPAGEVYVVPEEGPASRTAGELPVRLGGRLAVCRVEANRIVAVEGEGEPVDAFRAFLWADPARRNVAEFAIGCNEKAKVRGLVLEDEKAGMHWANGRSDYLGGTVGTGAFLDPANVVHQDWVYARDSPIRCERLDLVSGDGTRRTVIADGELRIDP